MTGLLIPALAVVAVVLAYRLAILSPVADTARRWTRRVFNRRDRIHPWKRKLVYVMRGGTCRLCRCRLNYRWQPDDPRCLEVDHWHTPWAWGGSDSIFNLAPVCRRENQAKGTRSPAEYRARA